MSNLDAYQYIIIVRDDLNGWIEERAFIATNSRIVSKFIYEEMIYRHECSRRIVMNRETENLDLTKDLLKHYRIQQILISIYHSQTIDLMKYEYNSLINFLVKYNK